MKIFIKYLKMYLPFILGMVLFSYGITNLFSSLLLFLGGYVAIKNTFDYRLVKRNIGKVKTIDTRVEKVFIDSPVKNENNNSKEFRIKPINHSAEEIIGFKRTRRYSRVRRRY